VPVIFWSVGMGREVVLTKLDFGIGYLMSATRS